LRQRPEEEGPTVTSNTISERFFAEAGPRLAEIYGEHQASILVDEIISLLQSFVPLRDLARSERWDQRDVILITYGDSLKQSDAPPLQILKGFLDCHLQGRISPFTSSRFSPSAQMTAFLSSITPRSIQSWATGRISAPSANIST
jgi:hypothetical protein